MFKRKNKEVKLITAHDLINIINEENRIPIPEYSRKREHSFIAKPRGTIFVDNIRRKKRIEL